MSQEPVQLAIISDEATPYRLHVLRRIARELPEVRLHSIFTHTRPSMPWEVTLEPEINPVVFPELSLNDTEPVSSRSLPLYWRLRNYLLEKNIQMVILLGYNNLTRALLIRWAHKQHLPLLLTGDSNIFGDARLGPLRYFAKRHYVRWVVKSVAGLMPMGVCGRAYFKSHIDHDKPTFLFPYEPDYSRLASCDPAVREAFMTRHGLDPRRRRLLYCGRLIGIKRVDVLIDAFDRIADYRPEWDLVITGDGPLKEALQARVPGRLRQRVKWTGFVQFEETVACYHACDVLVLPSEYEPWALVINEAVAAGLAVVSSDVVGAAAELVRHGTNGLTVPARSVSALQRALLDITELERLEPMKRASAAVLQQWRLAGDPVEGVRQAVRHFQLYPLL